MITCSHCHRALPDDAYYPKNRVCKDCKIIHICRIQDRRAKGPRTTPIERPCSYCPKCYGLSWRRPKRGLCTCGLRYAPEPLLELDPWQHVDGEECVIVGEGRS